MNIFEEVAGAVAGHFIGESVKNAVAKRREKASLEKQEPAEKKTGNSIFDWLKEKAGYKDEAEKIQEDAQKERAGIFRSVAGSVAERYCPTLMKMWDSGKTIASMFGVIDRGAEVHPLQHEIESITALSLFTPAFLLRYLTEPLRKSETFQQLVEHWPLMNQSWIDKMKDDKCAPDDVISVLRIINQDIVSGKATFDKVSGFFTSEKSESSDDVLKKVPKSSVASNDNAKADSFKTEPPKSEAPPETPDKAA